MTQFKLVSLEDCDQYIFNHIFVYNLSGEKQLSPIIIDSCDVNTLHAGFTRMYIRRCFHVFLSDTDIFMVPKFCLLVSVSREVNHCIHGTCYSKR